MRAEVKVGLIVALVAFAGGAIWLLSRKSDKLDSLPINKKQAEAANPDGVKLAPETVPLAKVPQRPRTSPDATPGHARTTPAPARRKPLFTPPKAEPKPHAGGGTGNATARKPGSEPKTNPPAARTPVVGIPPAGPLAGPLGEPITPATPAGAPPAKAAAPTGKTKATATKTAPGAATPPPTATIPPTTGIKTADTKLPTIIPPRKRSPFGSEPGAAAESRKPSTAGYKTYTVEPGDRLIDIARDEYGDGKLWKAIVAANPDLEDPDRLLVGQKIKLPPLEQARRLLRGQAAAPAVAKPALRAGARPAGAKSKPAAGATYVVGQGDSLIKIARNVLGDASRWKEIYELNRDKLESPDLIVPGMELRLPPKKPASSRAKP